MQNNKVNDDTKYFFAISKSNNSPFELRVKSGDGSDFSFLISNKSNKSNKYKNIKYLGTKTEKPGECTIEHEYHRIQFNNENFNIESIKSSLGEFLNNNNNNNLRYDKLLQSFIDYFIRVKFPENIKKLIGDIGEAIFVLECINRNLWFNINHNHYDFDTIDFKSNNGNYLEIKTSSKISNNLSLSYNQSKLSSIKDLSYIIILCDFNLPDSLSIINIYDLIKDKIKTLPDWLEKKYLLYKDNQDLINQKKVSISSYIISFIDKNVIPKIEKISNDDALIGIEFKLNLEKIIDLDDNENFWLKLTELIKTE